MVNIDPIRKVQAIGKSNAKNGYLETEIRSESHIYESEMEVLLQQIFGIAWAEIQKEEQRGNNFRKRVKCLQGG